jgi:hypothetical protein
VDIAAAAVVTIAVETVVAIAVETVVVATAGNQEYMIKGSLRRALFFALWIP